MPFRRKRAHLKHIPIHNFRTRTEHWKPAGHFPRAYSIFVNLLFSRLLITHRICLEFFCLWPSMGPRQGYFAERQKTLKFGDIRFRLGLGTWLNQDNQVLFRDSFNFPTLITKIEGHSAFGKVWRFAKYPCLWNDGRIKSGFAMPGLLVWVNWRFWATHVNRKWNVFSIYKPWGCHICIAKNLNSYRD